MTGADMEEKDSQGHTVLHTALKLGRVAISKHIFENYPPSDVESMYDPPRNSSLLALTVQSKEPELVWLVLENKLASALDIDKAWQQMTSSDTKSPSGTKFKESDKYSDIIALLKKFGTLTPPATPLNTSDASKPFHSQQKAEIEKEHKKQQSCDATSQASSAHESAAPPPPTSSQAKVTANNQESGFRGRGRGRGRGKGRGRGRGRGQQG
jgi:hypothetical protein